MAKYIRLEHVSDLSIEMVLELVGALLDQKIESFDQLSDYSLECSSLKINVEDLAIYDQNKALFSNLPIVVDPDAENVNWELIAALKVSGCRFENRPFIYDQMKAMGKSMAFLLEEERLVEIRTNIDDMSGEVYSHLINKLLSAGARDVYVLPAMMKKNRPAQVLCVLIEETIKEKISQILFNETTTFGIRYYSVDRIILDRQFKNVDTLYGTVSLKCGFYDGKLVKCIPEYGDCIKLAEENSVSFNIVYQEALFESKKLTW